MITNCKIYGSEQLEKKKKKKSALIFEHISQVFNYKVSINSLHDSNNAKIVNCALKTQKHLVWGFLFICLCIFVVCFLFHFH